MQLLENISDPHYKQSSALPWGEAAGDGHVEWASCLHAREKAPADRLATDPGPGHGFHGPLHVTRLGSACLTWKSLGHSTEEEPHLHCFTQESKNCNSKSACSRKRTIHMAGLAHILRATFSSI